MNDAHRPVILYVENDANDVILLRITFEKIDFPAQIIPVPDGEKAQAYLDGLGAFEDRHQYPRPDLVLMDLKMPRVSGFEVTRWIRAHPALDALPIVILTSSEHPEDRAAALAAGANGFCIKPVGLDELEGLVREISQQWLHLVPHG